MSETHDLVIHTIKAELPGAILDVEDFRGERTVLVPMTSVHKVLKLLRDNEDLQFIMLEDIVADDYYEQSPRFYVSYHLYSLATKSRVRVRTAVEDPEAGPLTIGDLWQIGTWLEMEVYDLMGIHFDGNGALRRLFLPEDWQGHPLRKDYPLGYEEIQFTFNYKDIDAKKPYAKE